MSALHTLITRQMERGELTDQDLCPPASTRDLANLGTAFNAVIPADLLGLLGLTNGQPAHANALFGRWRPMGVKDILEARAVLDSLAASGDFDGEHVEADCGVRQVWWHTNWLPFAANGAGDHLCLDLAPDVGGNLGQVIEFQHDDCRRKRLSASLHDWILNK